jgi:hypothetical protein
VPYINQPGGGGGGGAISGVTVTGTAVADAVPVASSASAGAWALPHDHEFDYVEKTTPLTVTATTEGTAQTWIDGNAVTYDGSTRIKIESWANSVEAFNGDAVAVLVDGSTSIGWLCEIVSGTATAVNTAFYGVRYLTPTNAAHTYHVKWFKTAGTTVVSADVGGAGKDMPAFMRITKA